MLGDRKELHVREAHLGHVIGQLVRELAVAERLAVALAAAPPGAQVDLVDRDRLARGIVLGPTRHPLGIAPLVPAGVVDHGGRGRAVLVLEPDRVALEERRAAALRPELVLVECALAEARNEHLPDPHAAMAPHHVAPAVPLVERADHAHTVRVRRPHGEAGARDAIHRPRMRAELLVHPQVVALSEQVQVQLAQRGTEAVRVLHLDRIALGPFHPEPVAEPGSIGDQRLEEAGLVHALHLVRVPAVPPHDLDPLRAGKKGAHDHGVSRLGLRGVHSEHRVRVVVDPADHALDVLSESGCWHVSRLTGAFVVRMGSTDPGHRGGGRGPPRRRVSRPPAGDASCRRSRRRRVTPLVRPPTGRRGLRTGCAARRSPGPRTTRPVARRSAPSATA
jgi:hypothetical protein